MITRVLQALLVLLMLGNGAAAVAGPSVLVRTDAMQQSPLSSTVSAYGVLTADTRQTLNVNFPRSGEVERLMVTAGQTVKRGDALLLFRTDPLETLAYQQAKTALAFARQEVRRAESLVEQRLATQTQLAAARKALSDAQASLEALARQGKGTETELVTAPFDGIVLTLMAGQGDRTAAGATLLQLVETASLRATLGVEPEDIHLVLVGLPVHITPVFDHSRTVEGKVLAVNGVINPQTRLVNVEVEIDGGAVSRFIPGLQVLGEIILGSRTSWVVPRNAVLSDAQGAFIYQIDRGRARRVPVVTAEETDLMVAVSGPFDPALKVVVQGNYELQDGMAVREETP